MQRLRAKRAQIAPADSHEGTNAAGADVYQGRGRFTGRNTVEVDTTHAQGTQRTHARTHTTRTATTTNKGTMTAKQQGSRTAPGAGAAVVCTRHPQVNGKVLRFRKAVIATGGRHTAALVPPRTPSPLGTAML